MSVGSDLLIQIATYLDAHGIGVYRPDGDYDAADTPIVFGPLPASPDRGIGLWVYGSSDYVRERLSEIRVQFRCRGVVNSTVDADDLAWSIFDVLQGLQDQSWGELWLSQCSRHSGPMPLGIDDNQRAECSDNYIFRVNTPPTVGRPV